MVGTMATSPAPETPYASDFSVILHYDPMMVAELAMGADHPHEIAERYGVDTVDYEHLAAQEWFARLVAQKRTEFHDQGVLFTAKAGMMAEALLTRLFQQSMAAVLPPPLMVEVAKQLTDIGRLKPQPLNTQPGQGAGRSRSTSWSTTRTSSQPPISYTALSWRTSQPRRAAQSLRYPPLSRPGPGRLTRQRTCRWTSPRPRGNPRRRSAT